MTQNMNDEKNNNDVNSKSEENSINFEEILERERLPLDENNDDKIIIDTLKLAF